MSCKDKKCPDYLLYRLPATLYPTQDTFNIGDTIWFEMDYPQILVDEMGGVENLFIDYDFNLSLQCARIDTNPPIPQTIEFFDLHTLVGQDSAVDLGGVGISEYKIIPFIKTEGYAVKCAVITKRRGLFFFGIGPVEQTHSPFSVSMNCTHLNVEMGTKLNNDDENNFYLLKYAENSAYKNYSKEQFMRYGSYCIVVR